MEIKPIAHIRSQFPEKFGIPRQSGLISSLRARVVFEPEFRVREALRGIEGYSHLWLLWHFSKASASRAFSPTVRPPRLGGNQRVGVFASRSPNRPNPIGLSCVELAGVDYDGPDAPSLLVLGADLMDGTPIFDIKPYLPQADCHPEATGGFTDERPWQQLEVEIAPELLARVPEGEREALLGVLAADPRPQYHNDPQRVYGMSFAGLEVRFRVEGERLTVLEVGR